MVNSEASIGNYIVKSDGNHNGFIPIAIIVNINPKHISIWFQFTLQCVSLVCVKMTRYQITQIYILKTDKTQCSKYIWQLRVAKSTESFKLKNIAHSDETAYNDYK